MTRGNRAAPVKHLLHFQAVEEWEIRVTNELLGWTNALDERSKAQRIAAAITAPT